MFGKISDVRSKVIIFYLVLLSAIFKGCFSAAHDYQPLSWKNLIFPKNDGRYGSSVVFPVRGNVYPLGYYAVLLKIGNPPKVFDLDIDSGSDLTWVQCDAPCTRCTLPTHRLYKPKKNTVHCADALCSAVNFHGKHPCSNPRDQCDYEVEYADLGSSLGVLVRDSFPLQLTNGSRFSPDLAFGCGYDQHNPGPQPPPPTAGVLGLGNGKASFVSQLHELGVTRNMFGHCLGRQDGYLFLGSDILPSSGITWIPMLGNSRENYYSAGPVELYYGGKSAGIKGLTVVFDSGSTYSYFSKQVYQAVVDMVNKEVVAKSLKNAPEDHSLPKCWKGAKPFKSINDVKSYFKPLALSFTKSKNVQLQLPPESYVIVTKQGNVCLGIMDGSDAVGNYNILGDVFMQDKMVIYDNEKKQIGWVPAACNRLPKS